MIQEVYLFTNRVLLALDELGHQVHDVQEAIGWERQSYHSRREQDALMRIIEDNPTIHLAQWTTYRKFEINIDELCSILGYGKWYWEQYKL